MNESDETRAADRRVFVEKLLRDLDALESMLESGAIESGVRRIGAEQEMFLVDRRMRPAPINQALLAKLDGRFTAELGRFNIEANLPPVRLQADALQQLEAGLSDAVSTARREAAELGADVLLAGVAPTLTLGDLGLDNMTPAPRYRELNDALMALRGESYAFFVKGVDEIRIAQQSLMLEACNTSFQVHFQVGPEEFARFYNAGQLATAPLLAASVNSPLLFGKRLWAETRIALFEQAVDTRRTTQHLRELRPRVGFGYGWVDDSVVEIFREDIVRFRVILAAAVDEDPFAVLADGGVPRLAALCQHNGTVYRWNRPCYGVFEGKAHLRIENRVLPSGPTVLDEVANAALWFGLLSGLVEQDGDVRDQIPFADVRRNFLAAAQHGLRAPIVWLDGRTRTARDLLLETLLPLAHEGLLTAGIASADADRYLGVIEERVASEQTGARWMLRSYESMPGTVRPSRRMGALARAMVALDREGLPVHRWPLASLRPTVHLDPDVEVRHEMTTDLITVGEGELAQLAAQLMTWGGHRQVPVEDASQRPVGVISWEAAATAPAGATVADCMDAAPAVVAPDTTVAECRTALRERGGPCVLVAEDGELVGMLTARRLAAAAHSAVRG